jgi:transcriptional regulator with XRE-family HTH domain
METAMRNEPGEQEARERMGANIQERRESSGMSQRQLADRAGIDRRTLRVVERGERWPRLTTLWLLGVAFGGDAFAAFWNGIRREPSRDAPGHGVWIVDKKEDAR